VVWCAVVVGGGWESGPFIACLICCCLPALPLCDLLGLNHARGLGDAEGRRQQQQQAEQGQHGRGSVDGTHGGLLGCLLCVSVCLSRPECAAVVRGGDVMQQQQASSGGRGSFPVGWEKVLG
jgi:hypothetical protein